MGILGVNYEQIVNWKRSMRERRIFLASGLKQGRTPCARGVSDGMGWRRVRGHHVRPVAPRSCPRYPSGPTIWPEWHTSAVGAHSVRPRGIGWNGMAPRARPPRPPRRPALMPSLPARRPGRGRSGTRAPRSDAPRSRRAHATRSSRNRAWLPAWSRALTCGFVRNGIPVR